ncbi:hypothetical protein DIPPA_28288 [Diplonema papillatum]|nr:hypothetical protein DIPPA_28288 [Diplonema papillatum]
MPDDDIDCVSEEIARHKQAINELRKREKKMLREKKLANTAPRRTTPKTTETVTSGATTARSLNEVEGVIHAALTDWKHNRSAEEEDDAVLSYIVNTMLGSGDLHHALGESPVSHAKATKIAQRLLAYYKEHSSDVEAAALLEILAQEGLAQHILSPSRSPKRPRCSIWDEDPFAWWHVRPDYRSNPQSIRSRLHELTHRCEELSAMLVVV